MIDIWREIFWVSHYFFNLSRSNKNWFSFVCTLYLFNLITLFFSHFILDKGINPPFISPWYTLAVNGSSPVDIPHPLGEIPGKVDVQVKVVEAGQEYIFPGIGSGQSDDDILAEYGGVAYLYNHIHVRLFIPIEKSDSNGIGRIVTTGKKLGNIMNSFKMHSLIKFY